MWWFGPPAGFLLAALLLAAGCGAADPAVPPDAPPTTPPPPAAEAADGPVRRAVEELCGEGTELISANATETEEGVLIFLCVRRGEDVRVEHWLWREGQLLRLE